MPRFLVVDDDPSATRAMAALLTDDGHSVAPFTGGADAIDALSRQPFDAVVTDLEMPRVDGEAVLQATRAHQPEACVVVATAKADDRCAELLESGACMVADKPLEYAAVAKEIADCRARGGPGPHGRCQMRSRPHGERVVSLRRK
jgi:two-component system response regulator QseB